ncbi:hypothetical protein B0I37DRAFT_345361 [Chaetomium sp. MPI-CAGE-AT-0009]|nr:hypothetical protein B0I37DRAFT_345361 [Chaetomium sp. MPI-CAGE-AT-0009]
MARLSLFCLFGRLRRREKRKRNSPSVTPTATLEQQQPTLPVSPPVALPITLETLPPELRHLILGSIDNLEDLKTLVFASPVYHQQYLHSRRWFLRRTLQTTLGNGNVLADAYAAHTSGSLHEKGFESVIHPDTFRLFMDQYIAHRSVDPEKLWAEAAATEEDLAEMAAFYLAVARPLLQPCASLFLTHLNSSLAVGRLSRAERTRLLRALYRYQTYCNIFGMRPGGDDKPFDLPNEERLVSFFGLFSPWEVEEICCIYILVRNKYEDIFDAIQADVDKDHPRFHGSENPYAPAGSFNLSLAYQRTNLREGTASRGLRPFLEVVQASDHETLVGKMQQYMVAHTHFIEDAMTWSTQHRRRQRYPTAQDQAQTRRDRLPFPGDDDDPGGPPLAWVIMWRGQYKNEYGRAIEDRFKKWGYVFWDCKRLNASGRKEKLASDLRNPYMGRRRRA